MQQDYFVIEADTLFYSPKFFEDCMCNTLAKPGLRVLEAKFVNAIGDADLVGEGSKYDPSIPNQIQGLHHYTLTLQEDHKEYSIHVLVKSKTSMKNFVKLIGVLPKRCAIPVSDERMSDFLWCFFENLDRREMGVMQLQPEKEGLKDVLPLVYGLYDDVKNEEYVVIREMLLNAEIFTDYTDISKWNDSTIRSALTGFAQFHAVYYENTDVLSQQAWMMRPMSAHTMCDYNDVFKAFLGAIRSHANEWVDEQSLVFHQTLLDTLGQWWSVYDKLPKTLTYADPQPRNLAMRLLDQGKKQLCLFDLETIEVLPPQRDVVEFLIYVTTADIEDDVIQDYLDFYRCALVQAVGREIDSEQHMLACRLSLYHCLVYRIAFQVALMPVIPRSDMERVYKVLQRYLRFFE